MPVAATAALAVADPAVVVAVAAPARVAMAPLALQATARLHPSADHAAPFARGSGPAHATRIALCQGRSAAGVVEWAPLQSPGRAEP